MASKLSRVGFKPICEGRGVPATQFDNDDVFRPVAEAVAVMLGPAGRLKDALPLASVMTVRSPIKFFACSKPGPAQVSFAKNSIMKDVFGVAPVSAPVVPLNVGVFALLAAKLPMPKTAFPNIELRRTTFPVPPPIKTP